MSIGNLFKLALLSVLILSFTSCGNAKCKRLKFEITNRVLIEQMIKFDSTYRDKADNPGAFNIHLRYLKDGTKSYSIGYAYWIGYSVPFFECEPVVGKPVYVSIDDLTIDFDIDTIEKAEFLKDYNKEDYLDTKKYHKDIKRMQRSDPDIIPFDIKINDEVGSELVFSRDNELLRVDTLGFPPR